MNRQGKAWGTTELVFESMTTSVHFLNIRKGGYCSEHQHGQKLNHFYVISGELEVLIWPEGVNVPDSTVLYAGHALTIPINVWHKFQALKDTLCIETYEVRFAGPDIERRVEGGKEKA